MIQHNMCTHTLCHSRYHPMHCLDDRYGNKLASCSSDQKIKIYTLNDGISSGELTPTDSVDTDQWTLSQTITAHNTSILKLSWCHPEFGTLLASLSSDKTIHIYQLYQHTHKRVAKINEFNDSITCIKFVPRHLGLKLCIGSIDGTVRLYDCNDIINLASWTLCDTIDCTQHNNNNNLSSNTTNNKHNNAIHSISFSNNMFDVAMISVAVDNTVRIYAQSNQSQPSNTYTYTPNSQSQWISVAELSGHTDVVNDVSWSELLGRSYHTIATACSDGVVRIYELHSSIVDHTVQLNVKCVAEFNHHHSPVTRVSWNSTGTLLCSTGDDCTGKLYRADYSHHWHQILTLQQNNNN